jgi:regulator of Ty1 transposition protein 103
MGISEPFSVEALDFKLKNDLNKSQESVQSISRWLIKNHEHGDVIVKSWLRTLLTTDNNSKKKSLVYLANDLLQNGLKRGAPFRKFFLPHLPGAFASFGICDQRLLKSLMNVLAVWESRTVFTEEYVKGLRGVLFAEQRRQFENCVEEQKGTPQLEDASILEESYNVNAEMNETAKKLSETLDDAEAVSSAERKKREAKRKRKKEDRKAKKAKKKKRRIELGPPPETKIDLSKLEQDIIQLAEDAASSDIAERQKLAALPNEVQDESTMDYINEWGSLELMYQLVNRAGKLVGAFTDRVMDEQKYRTVLTKTLMHAKNEQLAVFKHQKKELKNNRRIIEAFSNILDGLDEEKQA